jgi:Aminoglycoside adenylyltransferase, C-terminal domain/Nucleotidyltransferase domain
VILHGSLTLDDYVPGHSDIDLLVVIDDPLGDARLAALTEAMTSRRAAAPGPVDLRLVTRQVAASPTPAPPMEAYLRLTPVSGVRLEERRHPAEGDLAVELSVCRAHGRSLLGAAPAELLGEVPDRWVMAAGDAQLAAWQAIGDDPPYAELTVLTACRVWRFAEEGRHVSKTAAAEWALERDPTLGVVGEQPPDRVGRRGGASPHPLGGGHARQAAVSRFTDQQLVVRTQARAAARPTLPDPAPPPGLWPWPSARSRPGCDRPANWNAAATPACGRRRLGS